MVGVFAAATARLTPEFVESFDPEKLAGKFVRVEKEFGVKFTKSNSTFNIVGHWEAVRKAHKSLLKLKNTEKFDEKYIKKNEETVLTDTPPTVENSPVNGTTESLDAQNSFNDEEDAQAQPKQVTPDKEPPLFRGKGNPKRGRFTTKESLYSAVPEPVFFLQYQDKTFSDAGSLDIDSVLEDFEKSQQDKKVTKEQLKKILEKNKDQMGKPLEKGIPKGAILPAPKVTEQSCDTFVVEDMLNPIPVSSVASSGIVGMPMISTDQTANSSYSYMGGGPATTSIEISNQFDSQMVTTYSVNAKMSTESPRMTVYNHQINNQGSVAVEHLSISDFYNHPDDHNGKVVAGVFSDNQCTNTEQVQLPELDSGSFSSMFESYDPQAMLNQIPVSEMTMNISEGSGTKLQQMNSKSVNTDTGLQGQIDSENVATNIERNSNIQEEIQSNFPPSRLASGQRDCDSNGLKMEMNGFEEEESSAFNNYTDMPENTVDFSLTLLPSVENNSSALHSSIDTISMAASKTVHIPDSVSSDSISKNNTVVPSITTLQTNPKAFLKSMPTGEEFMQGMPVAMAIDTQSSPYSTEQSLCSVPRSDCLQNSIDVSEKVSDSVRLPDAIISQVKDIAIATDNQEQLNTQTEANFIIEAAGNTARSHGKDEEESKVEKAIVGLMSEQESKNVGEETVCIDNGSSYGKSTKKASGKSKTKQNQEKTAKVSPLKIKKSRLAGSKVKEKTKGNAEKLKQRKGRKAKSQEDGNQLSLEIGGTLSDDNTDMARNMSVESGQKQSDPEKPGKLLLKKKKNSSNKEKENSTVKQSDDKLTHEMKEKQVFKCTECDYQGVRKKRLSEHMGRVHGLLTNGTTPDSPMFSCDECDKTFVFEKDLSRHKKIVHHGQIFVCLVCNKNYKSKYVYDRHTATHAEGYVQPKFKCQICEQEFTTKFSLSSHIKSKHLGVKKTYSCPTCGKTFSQIRSYRQHANVHAGIRPYTCEICGKSFTYDKSLKEHRYMHDTVRRFQCTVCQKAFRQQTCLLIHMKTHKEKKDHICSVCGREFTQKQSLLRHERIHTGDKPYSCKLCFKSYGDYAVIRKHIMMAHKSSKDSWKEFAFTEESKRSSHYIDGGPGYVPRVSYAKINQKRQETVIPPNVSVGNVNINSVQQVPTEIGNSLPLNLGETLETERKQLSSDISTSIQNNMIAIQDIYQMPSYSETLDFSIMTPVKVKQETLASQINHGTLQGIGADMFGNVCSQQQNLNIKSYLSSLAANPSAKVSESNADAYTSQFLNSPDIVSHVNLEKASVSSSSVKDELLSSGASSVSVAISDPNVAGSLVTTATTNNSWLYPGYSAAYFSPASYSNYQSSPDT